MSGSSNPGSGAAAPGARQFSNSAGINTGVIPPLLGLGNIPNVSEYQQELMALFQGLEQLTPLGRELVEQQIQKILMNTPKEGATAGSGRRAAAGRPARLVFRVHVISARVDGKMLDLF